MKTKRKRLFFTLAYMIACLAGCRRDDSSDASTTAIDQKDRKIQEALECVSNWQSHFDLFSVKRSPIVTDLKHEIAYKTDNEQYKKYMGLFIDAAFGIPTDADDSGAKLQQLDSFCRMTESAMNCAGSRDDWDTYWTIALRRLERIKEEFQKLKVRFPDIKLQEDDLPCLGRGGWDNCLKLARNEYGFACNRLAKLINNFLMTHTLEHGRWVEFHSRLEEITGRKIPIRKEVEDLWKERHERDKARMTNKQ